MGNQLNDVGEGAWMRIQEYECTDYMEWHMSHHQGRPQLRHFVRLVIIYGVLQGSVPLRLPPIIMPL